MHHENINDKKNYTTNDFFPVIAFNYITFQNLTAKKVYQFYIIISALSIFICFEQF
jgi:hypothetical protein